MSEDKECLPKQSMDFQIDSSENFSPRNFLNRDPFTSAEKPDDEPEKLFSIQKKDKRSKKQHNKVFSNIKTFMNFDKSKKRKTADC